MSYRSSSRRRRRPLIAALAVVVVLPLAIVAPAGPFGATAVSASETAAERAAREIADARDRANAATDAYFAAESRLDDLAVEAEMAEGELAEIQQQVDELDALVTEVAVNRFTQSSESLSPLFNGFSSPEEHMQISALSAIIADTSDEQFDLYDSAARDLVSKKNTLAALRQQTEQQKLDMASLLERANAEVEQLKRVEAQRLKDEEVRKALAAEQRRRDAAAAKAASSRRASGGTGSSGGTTGVGSGSGSAIWAGADWVCPTGTAPVGFGDTWNAPRSGGRRHQGVDMLGARGTPLLAVVSGTAKQMNNTLGGNAVWLTGSDGNSYYYAHLDSFGALGAVNKGAVIGYLGDTGNATGTPHLHFEIHPRGGAAVNPYPTVRARC